MTLGEERRRSLRPGLESLVLATGWRRVDRASQSLCVGHHRSATAEHGERGDQRIQMARHGNPGYDARWKAMAEQVVLTPAHVSRKPA